MTSIRSRPGYGVGVGFRASFSLGGIMIFVKVRLFGW